MFDGEFGQLFENTKKLSERFGKINEWFAAQDLPEYLDTGYSVESLREMGLDEDTIEEIEAYLGSTIEKAKEALIKISTYAKQHGIEKTTDLPGNFPTLWIETSDAYDMAEEGDYEGMESVLDEVINYASQLEG